MSRVCWRRMKREMKRTKKTCPRPFLHSSRGQKKQTGGGNLFVSVTTSPSSLQTHKHTHKKTYVREKEKWLQINYHNFPSLFFFLQVFIYLHFISLQSTCPGRKLSLLINTIDTKALGYHTTTGRVQFLPTNHTYYEKLHNVYKNLIPGA